MSAAQPGRGFYVVGVLVVVAIASGVLALGIGRASETRAEAARRAEMIKAGPRASVVVAKRGAAGRVLDLQGEARPYASVTLYAKVSGYLRSVPVDRGDRVREGQTLAVIQSPELDRQLDAAKAHASQKRANARRVEALAGPGAVSVREAEIGRSEAAVADAAVASLASQKSFAVLKAPFAGTVTARHADPGALVQNATSGQSGALPVVTVSQIERLRVFVYVDQRDAGLVRIGDAAAVSVPATSVSVKARVARVAGELDPRTRTMLVEVDLDNKDGKIVAGSFVNVRLSLAAEPLVEVPAEALVLRAQKPFVAIVDTEHRVRLRSIEIAQHDGERIKIKAGVSDGDVVALNVGHGIGDGDLIQPVPQTPPPTMNDHAPKK